jgi:imidazolonepropionase-like amidohydrolase
VCSVDDEHGHPVVQTRSWIVLLVEVGLTREALRATRPEAADFSSRSADIGTIEAGKVADALLP